MKWQGFIKDNFEIVRNKQELVDLVVSYTDESLRGLMDELVHQVDYNEMKLQTDLINYEMELEHYYRIMQDNREIENELLSYITTAKRISRDKLVAMLGGMKWL